jgi:hypothetical protein
MCGNPTYQDVRLRSNRARINRVRMLTYWCKSWAECRDKRIGTKPEGEVFLLTSLYIVLPSEIRSLQCYGLWDSIQETRADMFPHTSNDNRLIDGMGHGLEVEALVALRA